MNDLAWLRGRDLCDPDYEEAREREQRTGVLTDEDRPEGTPLRFVCAECYVGEHRRCDGRRYNGERCECSACAASRAHG